MLGVKFYVVKVTLISEISICIVSASTDLGYVSIILTLFK